VEERPYQLEEALILLKEMVVTKFDPSCEIHLNLNVDPKKADQLVRGTVVLPYGTGKKIKVIVFTEENPKTFLEVGALKAGGEDLIAEVEKGFLDFDVAVAEPPMMKKIAKLAKVLGPKGLMPSPKANTVTDKPLEALKELLAGRVEFKTDPTAIIHSIFGKASFEKEKLLENLKVFLKAIVSARPSGIKGTYIMNMTICTTMGPGIRLENKVLGELGRE